MSEDIVRCFWANDDPLMAAYHDNEWGYPQHDDQLLFEYLVLDTFQAGLSWQLMLTKRENFRQDFAGFDAQKIARFSKQDVQRLLQDPGIVRNRLKIEATITNARCFARVAEEFGTFDRYIWRFTEYRTLRDPRGVSRETMLTSSKESDAMAQDLKQRGFKFVGTTTCYAYMQGIGMVNDHINGCFRLK